MGASKVDHLEDNAQASSLNLDKEVFVTIEEIMDNAPEYQGGHERWSYNRIAKILKDSNYRMPSIAHERRQAEKVKNEKKEE